MLKLNSLKKESQELSKGTPLAAYMRSDFVVDAEREYLLLQHLPSEIREIVILQADENYLMHFNTDIAKPAEMNYLLLARLNDDQSKLLWQNFGFFSNTISVLIYPLYSWVKWGEESDLWKQFWEIYCLKLDLFKSEFLIDQDGIRTKVPVFNDDFYSSGTWSSGIDKNTREFIINFSEWGKVVSYCNIKSKHELETRWYLLERVGTQFLEKKVNLNTVQVKTIPVARSEPPQQDDLVREPTEKQLLIIHTLADRGKTKFRIACISFLTEFQKIRHIFDEDERIATKVRTVQDRMKSAQDLPSNRTLEDWIKTYELASRR